ncbi:MAG: C45 family autoproteolytic acyltransferase/hydrolase [Anaerolineaceae bacterium]
MSIDNHSLEPRIPPIIRVSGSHREMGRQIGEAASTQVRHSLENARELMKSAFQHLQLSWEGAQNQSRKYLPFSQERYPKIVEELTGIAEGADVPFDDLMVLNAMEDVTMDTLHLTKCTSLGVSQERTSNGHILIAHNEDWLPEDEPDILIIHAKPDEEPAFLAMTYGGLLPNIGFNSAGIAQCCDSVYATDSRIGIPRVILSRAVLSARNPGEAIRNMLIPLRAAGYNHLLAHNSGELYNVEVSSRRFAILGSAGGSLAHTNHFLDPNMQAIENESDEKISTRVRYFRAIRLLQQTTLHSIETLQVILKDHVNYPNSICNHAIEDLDPLDREKTITSLVMDLTTRQMHVAWGNPCQNSYATFQMDD